MTEKPLLLEVYTECTEDPREDGISLPCIGGKLAHIFRLKFYGP